MTIVFLIIVFVLSVAVASFDWSTDLSRFETARRGHHDKKFADIDRFRAIYPGIRVLAMVLFVILAATFAVWALIGFGAWGGWLSLIIASILAWLATRLLRNAWHTIIDQNLKFFLKYFAWCSILARTASAGVDPQINSEHELLHVIEQSDFLSDDDRHLFAVVANWRQKTVTDVMVPRKKITFVHAKDELTPLFIDELFESGYRIFPVVNQDLDHVIGLLDLDDFREMSGHQATLMDKMHKIATPIADDANLGQVLEAFAKANATLLLVKREDRIVGLVSLGDVLRAIIGR
ncbi:MAG: CBS domain-containing protein [Candidatus Nanoperiomorbaceae bacterium]